MKPTHTLLIFTVAAAAAAMAGCTGPARPAAAKVDNFVIDETIKSASMAYLMEDSTQRGYATVAVSVVWPEKFGDASLRALQDTIIARCFNVKAAGQGIDSAIKRFVSSTDIFDDGQMCFTPVDSVEGAGGEDALLPWSASVDGTVIALDERVATYQITTTLFTGGAHPDTSVEPFSYDLRRGCVLDSASMFMPGSTPSLVEAIKEALARQLDTTVGRLDQAGIFTGELNGIGTPYINGDQVVFHYNPYEIAPYSMGTVDVAVWPDEIADMLTPEVRALFD